MTDLHVKYRPKTLHEVVGHDAVVHSLATFEEEDQWPHTFLFSGPSGVGKTTLARIIASELEAEVIEVDAATYSGVDNVRRLTDSLRYKPMDVRKPNKLFIIDECHSLSKQAWQALLKITEEPPSFGYFVFCTTESGKVPTTIKTRSHAYDLKPVPIKGLLGLLETVASKEKIDFYFDELEAIAEASSGSPRQALVFLSQASKADAKDLPAILASPGADPEVIEFCRELNNGRMDWKRAMYFVGTLSKTYPAESVRIIVVNYFSKVAMSAKKVPFNTLEILDAFSGEWPQSDKYAPMILALGELMSD